MFLPKEKFYSILLNEHIITMLDIHVGMQEVPFNPFYCNLYPMLITYPSLR
jgi:hypothetical protein